MTCRNKGCGQLLRIRFTLAVFANKKYLSAGDRYLTILDIPEIMEPN